MDLVRPGWSQLLAERDLKDAVVLVQPDARPEQRHHPAAVAHPDLGGLAQPGRDGDRERHLLAGLPQGDPSLSRQRARHPRRQRPGVADPELDPGEPQDLHDRGPSRGRRAEEQGEEDRDGGDDRPPPRAGTGPQRAPCPPYRRGPVRALDRSETCPYGPRDRRGRPVRAREGLEACPYGPRHLRGRRGRDVEGLPEGEETGFEIVR